VRTRLAVETDIDVVTAARSPLPDSASHLCLDLTKDGAPGIAELLAKVAPDVVVNCVGAVAGSAEALAAGNITGPAALLEAMLMAGRQTRLVHLGSAAEYGWVVPGVPGHEQTPVRPAGTYGVTKLAGTRLVGLARTAGLDAVVLRVFNPLGPDSPTSSLPGRLASEVTRALAEDDDVRLGPLDAVRDFVDARDVAEAVFAAVTAAAVDHPVLNVGSGRGVPVRALVDELLAIAGFTGSLCEDSAGSARSADVPWMEADLSTTGEALGWRPRIELTTSLIDLWKAVS
jgi:nucleoside-diphosphate-sugar epimerase